MKTIKEVAETGFLSEYDLKRGDFIKISGIWSEILVCNETHISNDRSEIFGRNSNWEVEAVLRPSVIVRDHLDSILASSNQDRERMAGLPRTYYLTQIHPKKEAIVDTKTAVDALSQLYKQGEEWLKKLDELEKLLASK